MPLTQQKPMDGESLVHEFCSTNSDAIKDQAIRAFLPLVKHILGRLNLGTQQNLTREDLYQFGIVGLMDALNRYNPQSGTTFKTFAYSRIHGEIIDAIRREGVLSRDQIQKLTKITDAKEILSKTLHREPTEMELEAETGFSSETISKVLSFAQLNYTVSLDEPIHENNGEKISQYEVLTDEDDKSPEQVIDESGIRDELRAAVQNLPERERLILALYYYEELTLADIAAVLELSEGRVSQILNKVHVELRQNVKR